MRDGSGCPKANNTKLAWLEEEGGPERLLQLSRGSWCGLERGKVLSKEYLGPQA